MWSVTGSPVALVLERGAVSGKRSGFQNFIERNWRFTAMALNIRPLYDRIVVKRIEETETVKGGIIIPDSAKEKPQEGEVVAVGKGKRLDDGKLVALEVQVGDRILFGKYSGNEIKIEGDEFLIVREDEILGVLEGGSKTAKA
jgi:chaperonin GroES